MIKLRHIRESKRTVRVVACLMSGFMLGQCLAPTAAFALTSGPAQPEFTSFEPVVTTNMVNDFTGDFMYNLPVLQIPGPNGGGYALSLSYHGGTSPEEEASWVGYGWTLNPGAINRQMRGVPDDWQGQDHGNDGRETIKQWNRATPNRTVSTGVSISDPEGFSLDVPISLNTSIRYNNYKGFGYSAGAGVVLADGLISVGYNVSDGEGSFSLQVNPGALLETQEEKEEKAKQKKEFKEQRDKGISPPRKSLADLRAQSKNRRLNSLKPNLTSIGNTYGMSAIEGRTYPLNATPYNGSSYTMTFGLLPAPAPVEVGLSVNFTGRYTTQANQEITERDAYGFLYTEDAADGNDMMDYHAENLTTYNKRDKFLQVPINDADMFSASGEGISGSMRLYPRRIHHFRPAEAKSETELFRLGAEVELGMNNGGGVDLQMGVQSLKVGPWDHEQVQTDAGDERYFFRMTGDAGGSLDYTTNTEPENAQVTNGSYSVPPSADAYLAKRSGRSSYVGFNTNAEMVEAAGGKNYRRYEKADLGIDRSIRPNQIGELSVINGQGQRYNYGLPVLARNEKNLSFSTPTAALVNTDSYDYATSVNVGDQEQKMGTENLGTYATAYLLTSITDPDYVDRALDGPTADDLGGWTRFKYSTHCSITDPFHWRMPYNGYAWSPGQLSVCNDDMVSYSSGDKEIHYLEKIETRSHVAVFRTSVRRDGYGAEQDPDAGEGVIPTQPPKLLERLDRIDLYERSAYEADPTIKAIKSVVFDYFDPADGAFPGAPNTYQGNAGKLTLRRVWFEHNGVVNAKIAPYQFDYTYTGITYPAGVPESEYASLDQTPGWVRNSNDPWGCYRHDGNTRAKSMEPWLDQTLCPGDDLLQDPPDFDPAAWQLKRIVLPSGGEIHVQYEMDDYAFVQDERAHVLCPLTSGQDGGDHVFTVDWSRMAPGGLTPQERQRVLQFITDEYINGGKKMYFKMLYSLRGSADFEPESLVVDERDQEFIEGYATVDTVAESGGLELKLSNAGYALPADVCNDLFNAEKRGMDLEQDCGSSVDWTEGSDVEQILRDFAAFVTSGPDPECIEIDPAHSYFRIPVPTRKVGGGLRVKRLLMYDANSSATDQGAVYGSEYIYKVRDEYGHIISSGVATNEPSIIREENILVRPLDRFNQSWASRVLSGRDKKQSEGPLGEGLYPGPSVGYSQVIVKNLHYGTKTSPAFAVKQFNTAKDFPVGWEIDPDGEMGADMTSIDNRHFELNIITGIFNTMINEVWQSQGFALKLNSMHGTMKSDATYSGSVDAFLEPGTGVHPLAAKQTETVSEYFLPGEMVPVQMDNTSTPVDMPLGREVDLTVENRAVKDKLDDGTLEIDIDFGIVGNLVVPFFSLMPSLTFSRNEIHTHTITKVINYPALLKRTKSFQDGIYHITENVAFDPLTGEPVQVRMNDGFLRDLANAEDLSAPTAGTYTKHAVPASHVYTSMGQVAKGEKKRIPCGNALTELNAEYDDTGGEHINLSPNPGGVSVCDAVQAMCIGDLFRIRTTGQNNATTDLFYHLASIDFDMDGTLPFVRLGLERTMLSNATPSDPITHIEIARSGCDNKLAQRATEYTVYADGGVSTDQDPDRVAFAAQLNTIVSGGTDTSIDPVLDFGLLGEDIFSVTIVEENDGTLELTARRVTPDEEMCEPPIDLPVPASASPFSVGGDGYLYYSAAGMECFPAKLECVQFTDPDYATTTVQKVVQCSATEFAHDVPYYDAAGVSTSGYEFDAGRSGTWRPVVSYAYNTPDMTTWDKNFNTGYFPMRMFNWEYPDAPLENWIATSTVTHYSPDGSALEEVDALLNTSCTKYGYDRMLPYLVAKNASLPQAHFESFEKQYGGLFEDGLSTAGAGSLDQTVAHSGSASLKKGNNGKIFISKTIEDAMVFRGGVQVRAWFRKVNTGVHSDPSLSLNFVDANNSSNIQTVDFLPVARSGEWVLYEGKAVSTWTDIIVEVFCINVYPAETWVDDVRIQPADAQMTTYVYDPKTFRLLTTFDDQHFGMYYQYNAEGKLVRKLIETERGMRTVQETQYNSPVIPRLP